MRYSKPKPIKNAVEAVFGSSDTDNNLKKLLKDLMEARSTLKESVLRNDYNAMQNQFLRLSILNTELADVVAEYEIEVNEYRAGMEAEKEAIYREQVAKGSSASMAYQVSGRLTKTLEAEYYSVDGQLKALKTITEAIRYLISDVKARLEYEKGNLILNNKEAK